jgi:hypothetical protein
MTPEQFVYWLQGFFELTEDGRPKVITPQQRKIIMDHLKLVMDKQTPEWNEIMDPLQFNTLSC